LWECGGGIVAEGERKAAGQVVLCALVHCCTHLQRVCNGIPSAFDLQHHFCTSAPLPPGRLLDLLRRIYCFGLCLIDLKPPVYCCPFLLALSLIYNTHHASVLLLVFLPGRLLDLLRRIYSFGLSLSFN